MRDGVEELFDEMAGLRLGEGAVGDEVKWCGYCRAQRQGRETQILKYYRVNFWIRQVGPIADMAHVGWSLVTRDYADVVGRDHLIFYP